MHLLPPIQIPHSAPYAHPPPPHSTDNDTSPPITRANCQSKNFTRTKREREVMKYLEVEGWGSTRASWAMSDERRATEQKLINEWWSRWHDWSAISNARISMRCALDWSSSCVGWPNSDVVMPDSSVGLCCSVGCVALLTFLSLGLL